MDLLFVISAFLHNAVKKYPKTTEIVIPVEAMEIGEALDKLVPSQKTDLMVEGILVPPVGAGNLTSADMTALINSLDQDAP